MPHPEFFYKYTSPSTALIILENSRLRWSSPLLFNDPAEFQRMPRFEPTIAKASIEFPSTLIDIAKGKIKFDKSKLSPSANLVLQCVKILLAQKTPEIKIASALASRNEDPDAHVISGLKGFFGESFLSTARVMCLTTNHSNDAMWANYAGGHKGCVLGFKHIPRLSTPFLEAKKVMYSEIPPVVGNGMDFLLYGDTKPLRAATINAVCYTKKIDWAYEQEWRAITWRPEEDSQFADYSFYPDELESVTIGSKASLDTELAVKNILREAYPNCNLYKLVINNGETSRALIKHCESNA